MFGRLSVFGRLSLFGNPRRAASPDALRRAVSGKVVVVTGGSEGIGREVARQVVGAGARAILIARNAGRLHELAAELGPNAHAMPCDLADRAAVAAVTKEIAETYEHVDVVVSNAGKSIQRRITDSYDRMHDFERLADVNYLGPIALLLGLLPVMGRGHIVNVSTIGVLLPPAPRWAGYVSSKAAFDVWLRSVAAELADAGLTTTSVYLALVHTRMSAPSTEFDKVPGLSPAEAAAVVCRGITDRPLLIAPWWARAADIVAAVSRRPAHAALRAYDRRLRRPR